MALKLIAATILSMVAAKRYNILSLDSAIYRGVMTANFVQYMERKAYLLAEEHQCKTADGKSVTDWRKPKNSEDKDSNKGKISMTELFDLIAGSETGAIIASTLTLKNDKAGQQKNRFFANKAIEYFEATADSLYKDNKMPTWGVVLITTLASILVGIPVFLGFERCFNVHNF